MGSWNLSLGQAGFPGSLSQGTRERRQARRGWVSRLRHLLQVPDPPRAVPLPRGLPPPSPGPSSRPCTKGPSAFLTGSHGRDRSVFPLASSLVSPTTCAVKSSITAALTGRWVLAAPSGLWLHPVGSGCTRWALAAPVEPPAPVSVLADTSVPGDSGLVAGRENSPQVH